MTTLHSHSKDITSSSTAEYFAKNLQQVGFSSLTKAVLTSIKEAVDNSLDACEDAGILPEIFIQVERLGAGTAKNADLIRVKVTDNGPGINPEDVVKVFGEYLASSKFGRGRCSRGQQGIGISAVTTWCLLTHGSGVHVVTKKKTMHQAHECDVMIDIKKNRGVLKNKRNVEWDRPHGVSCEFTMDGRVQLNGEGGLITYLQGAALVNPHLTLKYKLLDQEETSIEHVSTELPAIPEATAPHPHTMKLGEFLAHAHLFGRVQVQKWLKTAFSRISDNVIAEMIKQGMPRDWLVKALSALSDDQIKKIYAIIQKISLMAPSTKSVMSIGESRLAKSMHRLGDIDFFSVVSRKPAICDFKPVLVEVAVARSRDRSEEANETPVQILRFANRVPLQFDKAACAMTKAVESVNWRAYGLAQPKKSLPQGPYIIAVSVVSPFIKFKNASKETVDASDELVEEIRRALQKCGQKLSAHIRREAKMADMQRKLQHIEQFVPILVDGLCRITRAKDSRRKRALAGLDKILGRDTHAAQKDLKEAHEKAMDVTQTLAEKMGVDQKELHERMVGKGVPDEDESGQMELLPDD